MLNVVQLHDPSNLSLKMGTIVEYDLLWYPEPTNDVVLHELSHMLGFYNGVEDGFYLLGKVVGCH